jgi:hypothetical protein
METSVPWLRRADTVLLWWLGLAVSRANMTGNLPQVLKYHIEPGLTSTNGRAGLKTFCPVAYKMVPHIGEGSNERNGPLRGINVVFTLQAVEESLETRESTICVMLSHAKHPATRLGDFTKA